MKPPVDAEARGVAGWIHLPGRWYFQTEAEALMSLRNPQGQSMGLWSRKAAEDFAAAVSAGAIDRLETALKSMTRQMWEQSSRADEADSRRVAAEAGRAMMIDVQEHRNEASQAGWSDGYAEGYGKAQAALAASQARVAELTAELVLLDEVCGHYALDEARFLRDDGEPFGSVPIEAGMKARQAGRRYAEREMAELAERRAAADAVLKDSAASEDDRHEARFTVECVGYAEQRLALLLPARALSPEPRQ